MARNRLVSTIYTSDTYREHTIAQRSSKWAQNGHASLRTPANAQNGTIMAQCGVPAFSSFPHINCRHLFRLHRFFSHSCHPYISRCETPPFLFLAPTLHDCLRLFTRQFRRLSQRRWKAHCPSTRCRFEPLQYLQNCSFWRLPWKGVEEDPY